MKLIYNDIDNKDQNSIIYPISDLRYISNNIIRQEDINELDNYYHTLCEIIDECDGMLLTKKNNIIDKFKTNLEYKICKHTYNIKSYSIDDNYLFNIEDIKDKEFVKDNLTISLFNTTIEKNINIYKSSYVAFLKNNIVQYDLQRLGGRIKCYQKYEERKIRNTCKLNLVTNNNYSKKKIFNFQKDKNKLKTYLQAKYKDLINLDSVMVAHNYNDYLKRYDGYFYTDIYVNDILKYNESFASGYYFNKEYLLADTYNSILNDITNNKPNTYYFKEYESYNNQYISLTLKIENNNIIEISNKIKIKTNEYETNRRVGEILELAYNYIYKRANVNIDVNHLYAHNFTSEDKEKIKQYYKQICKIIDKCNLMILSNDNSFIRVFLENLKHRHFNFIDSLELSKDKTDVYLFDISEKNNKDLVKNNISYNLYDNMMFEDFPESILYPEIKEKFIANDESIKYSRAFIYFLIDNKIKYALSRYSGELYMFDDNCMKTK